MDKRKGVFFVFDTFVERSKVRDLSDLVIFFTSMKQDKSHLEALHSSRIPTPTIIHGHKVMCMLDSVPVPSQVRD